MLFRQKKKKFKLRKTLLSSVVLYFLTFSFFAQNGLEDYIPYPDLPWEEHPDITIRVHVHIIKRYENDPQNITKDSVAYLDRMMVWINNMYRYMANPTLPAKDGNLYFIPDSRIRFRLDTVIEHTDSSAWDRIRPEIHMANGAPWPVDSVNLALNEIGIKGGGIKGFIDKKADSLKIVGSPGNNGIYHKSKIRAENGLIFIRFKEPLPSSKAGGKISFFVKRDRNCSRDIWEKFTNSDKNALHIFFTGSSMNFSCFGCGPSPYFLNVSNLVLGGGYAIAQLSGHELGHCIGLSHTNFPQFADLPAKDKFGIIDCNSTETSNNILGYNTCRNYLSPMQVGYVHKRYSTDSSLIRTTTANEYDTAYNVEVWDDTKWNRAMVIKGDLIIRANCTLEVNKPVHMAAGSGVYIEKGARLIVNGTKITNYFDDAYWKGIIICQSYERKNKVPKKKKGKLELKNQAVIRRYFQE